MNEITISKDAAIKLIAQLLERRDVARKRESNIASGQAHGFEQSAYAMARAFGLEAELAKLEGN